MHKFLRKNAHVIVWIVVFAFVVGGGALGFGTYISARQSNAGGGQVFASVNGQPINYSEYQQRLAAASYQLSNVPESQALGYRYEILNSIIDRELLLQEAKKQKVKVTVTDTDVDEYINEVKTQYQLEDDQLVDALAAQNMTLAGWKQEIKGILVEDKKIETLLNKATDDVTVTDEEVIEEYEEVRLSNIFINKMGNDLGKERIEQALAEIKEGMDFVKAVKTYSEAGNVDQDGDLGFLKRSEYSDENTQLANVAFTLDVNEVSDIVETDTGYHILKVTDKKVAKGEEFEQAKAEVKETLIEAKKHAAEDEWFNNLKAETKIVINAPHLAGYKALSEQKFEVAAKEFQEAADQTPDSDLYLGFVAAAYNALDKPEKALEAYEKAMEINPTNWQNYYAAARLYKDKEENEKVVELLTKASDNAGDEYMARYQIRALAQQVEATDLVDAQDKALEEIAKTIQEQQEADAQAAEEAAAEQAKESANE